MEHADQREQAAGSVEIHVDLAFQPFLEQRRRVVVDAAPRHVDGLDLGGRGVPNRGIIAVADGEVIADRAAEGGEPQDQCLLEGPVCALDLQRQPPFLHREVELVGACIAVRLGALRGEAIFLEQVEDRDPALLLDVRRAPKDSAFVERHVYDARIGHD
ncbi:hypothetical protein QU38_02300, partial [Staphylococcus aureus]